MGDLIFGIGWLVIIIFLGILTILERRTANKQREKLNKIFKAMEEAGKDTKPGTPEHAKKTAELFEKEKKEHWKL